ncbi:MAG: glycosyltransferase family 4 protein [Candidatus Symbiothrix sp.]|jgi:glycosyltransferase involved in cell wall biosynthesis|nr:glycosyltransferase family 4 protein [Candidatus Symbiothrix sp.]
MKILFIVPGSGDAFYCGNCFRDNLQANSLRKAGHDIVVMPLYLPLKDKSFRADTPLFFPAISLYVTQKFFKKKSMPKWMERRLNSDRFLDLAASFSGSTSSEGMEDMTLSMINGDDLVFKKHVSELIEWIRQHERPDVVQLSSSLVIGIAKEIKQAMNIPVVCSLQDEEIWINALGKEAENAWRGIAENIKYIDRFVVSSEFYKAAVLTRFPLEGQIEVVYPGLDIEKYASEHYPADPTIGFFYRMNVLDGLDILAKAFVKVKQSGNIPHLKLRIGGGFSGADKKFLRKVRHILQAYSDDVIWHDTYSLSEHAAFYKETSAVCVPITFDEGVGLYVCEAFASGRPVVEPATGSFPEIVGNGGVLYPHNDCDCLAAAIIELFTAQNVWDDCRRNAIQLAKTRYNGVVQAEKLHKIYNVVRNRLSDFQLPKQNKLPLLVKI